MLVMVTWSSRSTRNGAPNAGSVTGLLTGVGGLDIMQGAGGVGFVHQNSYRVADGTRIPTVVFQVMASICACRMLRASNSA